MAWKACSYEEGLKRCKADRMEHMADNFVIGWWDVTQNVWLTHSLNELEMAKSAWVAFATKLKFI